MRKLISAAGIALIIFTAFLFVPRATPQQTSPTSTIAWSVPQLTETMFPGTSSTVGITFQSNHNLAAVNVWITPSLSGLVSASPTSFSSITANQPYQITLTLSAPPGFVQQSYSGTMHLRNAGSAAGTYAPPLAMNLETNFLSSSDTTVGVQFFFPTTMAVTQAQNAAGATLYLHAADEEFPGGGITISKLNQSLTSVLARISKTLTLTSTTSQNFNGQSWTINVYADPSSNQQFLDAFTVFNGSVYEVGGLASPAVANLLPALLNSFVFL